MDLKQLEPQALIAMFEGDSVDPGDFKHAEHVYLAWSYLRLYGLGETLARFPVQLKRFAERAGAPRKYHATVTFALVVLIHERMVHAPDLVWSDFCCRNRDLMAWPCQPLTDLYGDGLLDCEKARSNFVLPRLTREIGQTMTNEELDQSLSPAVLMNSSSRFLNFGGLGWHSSTFPTKSMWRPMSFFLVGFAMT